MLIVVFARRNAAADDTLYSRWTTIPIPSTLPACSVNGALWAVSPSACWCLRWRWPLCWWLAPAKVDAGDERASSRDIVLCLDVSGSTLPYDREVIDTYLELVKHFEGNVSV